MNASRILTTLITVAADLALVVACSPSESQSGQNMGGRSSTGGSSSTVDTGGSTSTVNTAGSTSTGGTTSTTSSNTGVDPNATAGCPTWPSSKLFPFIGAFFYGTDPKPCTIRQHADTVLTFQYDSAGQVVGAATADNTQSIVYTFTDGRMSKEVDTTGTTVSTYQFQYGAGTVTYSTSGGAQNYTSTYLLDARGYPQSATMVVTAPRAYTSHFTYTYDNCRMSARNETDDSGSTPRPTVQYAYDDQGRMVRMYAADGSFEWIWDYSCR